MTEGDVYIRGNFIPDRRPDLAVVERVRGNQITFRLFGHARNMTMTVEEFNREFRLANPREFARAIEIVRASVNHMMHQLESSLSQFRESKSTVEKLRDLAENQDIMSKEDVLKEHLASIIRDYPSINIGNNQNLIRMFSTILNLDLTSNEEEQRGNIDIDAMNSLRTLLRAADPRDFVIEEDEQGEDSVGF